MSNLAVNLKDAAGQFPHNPAVRLGREVLSYAGLDELSSRVAGGLIAHGIQPGDRVALALERAPAFAVLYYGVLRVGAVAVVLGTQREREGVRRRPDTFDVRLCFADRGEAAPPPEPDPAPRRLRVRVGADFLDQVAFWPQHTNLVHRADDDTAVITRAPQAAGDPSGTAATSSFSHRQLRAAAFAAATRSLDLTSSDTVLACAPMSGTFGQTYALNAVVLAGAGLSQPRDPEDMPGLTRTIDQDRVTVLAAEPALFSALARTVPPGPPGPPSPTLRLAVSSGPMPSAEIRTRVTRALGVPLLEAGPPTCDD